jgi:uncharacterized protein
MGSERRTALVTGATAGIGAAFARHLAADSYDLVLVARDEKRLHERATEVSEAHGSTVEVLPADLTTEEGLSTVTARLRDPSVPVDLLVNNAGFALNKSFLRTSAEDEEKLLRLHVHAVLQLTKAALPGMVERREGAVINVSSASGFSATMPGSTYPASKAWVNNFSASIDASVRRHGVKVMALCPGLVRTELHPRAGMDMSNAPRMLWLEAEDVVADAMRSLERGRVVRVVDWRYRLIVRALQLMPRRLLQRASRKAR